MGRLLKQDIRAEKLHRAFRDKRRSYPIEEYEAMEEQRKKTRSKYDSKNRSDTNDRRRYLREQNRDNANALQRKYRDENRDILNAKRRAKRHEKSCSKKPVKHLRFYYAVINVDTGLWLKKGKPGEVPTYTSDRNSARWYPGRYRADAFMKAETLSRIIPHEAIQFPVAL